MIRRAGLPLGPHLREHADVGRLFLHPSNETVEVVGLPVPHPVLDVPVEHPRRSAGSAGENAGNQRQRSRAQYSLLLLHVHFTNTMVPDGVYSTRAVAGSPFTVSLNTV